MFFNFFKQNDADEHIDNVLASVSYYIKSDGSGPYMNIEMADYDDDSGAALSKLLESLSQESCYLETIDMIKDSLIKNKQELLFLKILANVTKNVKEKIINAHKEKNKFEPCIKPSDMMND